MTREDGERRKNEAIEDAIAKLQSAFSRHEALSLARARNSPDLAKELARQAETDLMKARDDFNERCREIEHTTIWRRI